jgi:hypothetical protein
MKALQCAKPGYLGYIVIYIENKKALDKIPDGDYSQIECFDWSKYAPDRWIFISPNKDEIYGEHFSANGRDFYFDYDFIFGKEKEIFQPYEIVKSRLYPNTDVIIDNNIRWIVGSRDHKDTRDEILNARYCGGDLYIRYGLVLYTGDDNRIWDSDYLPSSPLYKSEGKIYTPNGEYRFPTLD